MTREQYNRMSNVNMGYEYPKQIAIWINILIIYQIFENTNDRVVINCKKRWMSFHVTTHGKRNKGTIILAGCKPKIHNKNIKKTKKE